MELEVSHTVLSQVKTKRIKKGEHFNWLGQVIRLGDNQAQLGFEINMENKQTIILI